MKAVDGVSFALQPGERFGLVGESGSGKSTIALSLLRLIKPPGRVEDGRVILDGIDLLELDDEAMRRTRLARISLVAQGAMNSLNPVKRLRSRSRWACATTAPLCAIAPSIGFLTELLEKVGLSRNVADMYPHELSGGMKQRVCIAIAISLQPQVIVADEPTSALDVVVQWQVTIPCARCRRKLGAAVIQIGHDMGLMAHSVDRIGVMYAGKLVEVARCVTSFEPLHPYTQLLIASLPSLDGKDDPPGDCRLAALAAQPAAGLPLPPALPVRHGPLQDRDALREIQPGHLAACHLYEAS